MSPEQVPLLFATRSFAILDGYRYRTWDAEAAAKMAAEVHTLVGWLLDLNLSTRSLQERVVRPVVEEIAAGRRRTTDGRIAREFLAAIESSGLALHRPRRDPMAIADRLRLVREEIYGEGGQVAVASALGLPARTWANYEAGVTIPGEVLLGYMELTGVEAAWLLRGVGGRYRRPGPRIRPRLAVDFGTSQSRRESPRDRGGLGSRRGGGTHE